MASLFEMNGGQPQKQPKYVPIFIDRTFTGLFTQRNPLHDPADIITAKYYGGRPDALWQGSNVELTNRLTLQRRPGLTHNFSTFKYPTPPNRAYSFQLTNGTIRVVVDTGSTGLLTLTSAGNASGGNTVYHGTITGGASNAFVGLLFNVQGFSITVNNSNGTPFLCVASTATTLTLANPNGTADSSAGTAESSGGVYWDHQSGGISDMLFAKGIGAGQTAFLGVGGILYMGDGVDTRKWTPLNTNTPPGSTVSVWNWGTPAPAAAPGVSSQSSGGAATSWTAGPGSTGVVWSTMGLLYDSGTDTVQQLNSVNGNPNVPNSTQIGTTATGQPAWNDTPGGTTPDGAGTLVWTNKGPVGTWTANTLYQREAVGGTASSPCCVYDPTTKALYYNANSSSAGTSGASKPVFKPGLGQITQDGGIRWAYLGPGPIPGQWQTSHAYVTLTGGNDSLNSVTEPQSLANGLPTSPPIYWQVCTTAGTSASSGAGPKFSTTLGDITGPDGNILWMCLGKGTWQSSHTYVAWSSSGAAFSAVYDGTNFQVCVVGGKSGGSTPSWKTTYGDITPDGDVTWRCVGKVTSWAASTNWYLPASGFFPPQGTGSYGGASVIDSNNNIEFVYQSGLGGASAPTWATTAGGTHAQSDTIDNAATWYNLEPYVAQSLVYSHGFSYAYSFKAMAYDDYYAALPLGGGNVPPGITSASSGGLNNFPWTGVPTGSATELISTASPAATLSGASAGAIITVTGYGSLDPQVDTIVIWRSVDGGSSGQMFELTEIPAPKPVNGIAQPWTFKDFLPSLPTGVPPTGFPGLNTLIPAPINESNDPPPITFLPMVYNFQRIWGADGTAVPFSGGPDVVTGNPNEAFAPADNLPFLAPVIRLVKTPQGIVTFLTDSIEIIAGGPLTSSFFSVTWAPGIGLNSFNALDVLAGEIYFFSSDNQFRIMTPSLNISNAGFALGDQFANQPSSGVSDTTWDPQQVYVASHQSGTDNCVFVADGNTGWYRLNPRQAGAQQNPEPIWSPYATISGVNGCQMVQSIETSPGVKKLLVGSNVDGQKILQRDQTVFTDDGSQYDAWFIMGSIMLCHPGQLALLKFMEFDFSGVSYRPTISYLLNEISGTFTPFTANPTFDPPSLYGTTVTPATYSPNRYYFLSNASLARCRHMQIKVDFGTTSNGDEIFNATIFGRVMVET